MTRARISGMSALVLLAGLLMGVLATRTQAAGELVTVTLVPMAGSVAVGDNVSVQVNVTSNGSPGGLQAPIQYDSSRLNFVSCSAAGGSQCLFNSEGQFTVSSSSLPASGQTATLATVVLHATFFGSASVSVSESCNAAEAEPPFTETGCVANNTSVNVTGGTAPTATFTNTATATNTRTNTPVTPTSTHTATRTATNTRTATPTRTSTNTPTITSTAVIGGGDLTPTKTPRPNTTPPILTATSFPTNTATATKTPSSTHTALPTNTSSAQTHTPTSTNTATNTPSGTATNTGTIAATATNTATKTGTAAGGATYTPTRTGGAPLPPSTGTGGDFGGTNTVAALFLVAIGLGVSGFAATRVTRKR